MLYELNSRFEMLEERICELKNKSVDIISPEEQREKLLQNEQSRRHLWGNMKCTNKAEWGDQTRGVGERGRIKTMSNFEVPVTTLFGIWGSRVRKVSGLWGCGESPYEPQL